MLKKNVNELYNASCFLIASICVYIILTFIGVTGGGDYTIIVGDMKDNYIPAILNLLRNIKAGESIFYSWNYGMGMNTALLNAYYAYSPFNLLYLLCPIVDESIVTVLLIMVKTGLAALCFRVFICKAYNSDGILSLIIPLCYSLCSYQIIYNTQNIIWLDAMYVLPMIFLGVYLLVREGRWIGLAFWYAFIFATQFYMGYMIGIISVAYFVLCLILYCSRDMVIKKCARYVIIVLLSVGLSSWSWLPTLMFLKGAVDIGASTYDAVNLNITDIINQLFWGEVSDYDAAFPYIYCGIPIVILAARFWSDKENDKKERIGFGILILLLIVSCLFMPLYIFWHGFDSPNSFGFRFSFIITFLLCTIAAIEGSRKKNSVISIKWALAFGAMAVLVYVGSMLLQKRLYTGIDLSNNAVGLCVNIVLILVWLIALKQLDKSRYVSLILAVLIVAELISNGYVVIRGRDENGRQFKYEEYMAWKSCQTEAAKILKQDDTFYRVNNLNDFGPSSGLYYGYNSMSYFGSAENVKLRNVLGYLGIWNSPRVVYCFGTTTATNMLFDVAYNIVGDASIAGTNDYYGHKSDIYVNNNVLGLGYMVNGEVNQYYIPSSNAFGNNNYLLSLMTGEDIRIYEKIDQSDYVFFENGLAIDWSDEGGRISYMGADGNKYASLLLFVANDNGKEYYAYVDNDDSYYTRDAYVLMDGYENFINSNGAMTVSYIKHMDRYESGPCLQIASEGYTGDELFDGLYVASYDENEKEKAYDLLKDNVYDVVEYGNGYVKGEIESTEEKKLMFTTIPYEKGWRVYVDGKEEQIVPLLNDVFCGIEFDRPGKHNVEFRFTAPGVYAGAIVTATCLGLYLVLIILYRRKMKAVNVE